MVSAKAVRNQMVPSRAEWRGETDNRATPPVGYCPSTASFSVRPYCKNARRDRCQEYNNCFPFRGLEETTRTSSNHVDEDYPARSEIKQSLTGWGDNCGSESSTLETDVCVWRYAPLVVHATQEEEEAHTAAEPTTKANTTDLKSAEILQWFSFSEKIKQNLYTRIYRNLKYTQTFLQQRLG